MYKELFSAPQIIDAFALFTTVDNTAISSDTTMISLKLISPVQSGALSWLENTYTYPFTSQVLAVTTETTQSSSSWKDQILNTREYKIDTVKRVVDASTIQLEKGGYVSLATVRGAGSTYQLPECLTYAPSYKLRQLLPKGSAVHLINLDGKGSKSSATPPRVWIIREKDNLLVNEELVKTGFAFVRKGSKAPEEMMQDLIKEEQLAKDKGLGIYKSCTENEREGDKETMNGNSIPSANFVAEFEPLDYTTEIEYGEDGGKSIVVFRKDAPSSSPPKNPGDIKGCSDFQTYEESLAWYETYFSFYGDVSKLDRDGDGVPCPGLPHTLNADRYRMKVPTKNSK